MVKFSDLEKGDLNPKKSQEKDSGELSRPSGLSFRDLEKETRRVTSREGALPKEVSEEERKAIYDTATDYVTGVLDAVRKRHRFTLESGEEIVRRIIESRSAVDPLLIRAIYQDNPHGYLINHCVNVAVFGIKIAAALGLSRVEQEQIGLAALLHEVGMGVIPEKLIYKEQKLDEQEYAIFKKRPEFAYKILKGFGDDYGFLADTALQVHECMDGSGYPIGLSGDEIHLYARIIGLVDFYEALIHSRPQRDKIPHFSALKQIIKIGKRRFSKKHLKALLNTFSLFPMHSLVRLNSNTVGKVIQTYPDQPMRPKIEVVFDSQGRRVLARQVINLPENSILYIVDSVSEKDIAGLAGEPAEKPYSQTPKPVPYGLESAVIQDIDDADGEGLSDADILEITEADFEPSPPATGKDASGPDQSAFTISARESVERTGELIDDKFVQLPAGENDRWFRRYKWVLLAVGSVILAGIAFWQLGLSDKTTNGPVLTVNPSEVKVSAGPQQKAKNESAALIVSKGEMEPTPAAPVPSKKEQTVAQTEGQKVSKEQMKSAPAPEKGPAAPPPKQAPAETAPTPAAMSPADNKKTSTPKEQPKIDNVRTEVAAGPKLSGDAAAIKARSGSYPFSIKLDSFRNLKEARSALPIYTAKGLNAYWVKVDLGTQGIWYRVFAGTYQTEEEAAAVISRSGLKNAAAKETKYAALIGVFSSRTAIDQNIVLLSDKGYSPYVIQAKDQTFFLFVGAFYTRKGAEEQVADLLTSGIQSEIMER
ncbi:MAG: SPOR domain-containing protein [Desulfobacterales bacterium]|nr:SPOR domain-containing protein [Desulfobacterales bacterium]